jgi:hypothetical protein
MIEVDVGILTPQVVCVSLAISKTKNMGSLALRLSQHTLCANCRAGFEDFIPALVIVPTNLEFCIDYAVREGEELRKRSVCEFEVGWHDNQRRYRVVGASAAISAEDVLKV